MSYTPFHDALIVTGIRLSLLNVIFAFTWRICSDDHAGEQDFPRGDIFASKIEKIQIL
jgi:hypothetical protein